MPEGVPAGAAAPGAPPWPPLPRWPCMAAIPIFNSSGFLRTRGISVFRSAPPLAASRRAARPPPASPTSPAGGAGAAAAASMLAICWRYDRFALRRACWFGAKCAPIVKPTPRHPPPITPRASQYTHSTAGGEDLPPFKWCPPPSGWCLEWSEWGAPRALFFLFCLFYRAPRPGSSLRCAAPPRGAGRPLPRGGRGGGYKVRGHLEA